MATNPVTLGARIISELRSRQMFGAYFNYRAYQQLKEIDDYELLEEFMTACKYPDAARAAGQNKSPWSIIQSIKIAQAERDFESGRSMALTRAWFFSLISIGLAAPFMILQYILFVCMRRRYLESVRNERERSQY
jgi:hypothetical protein